MSVAVGTAVELAENIKARDKSESTAESSHGIHKLLTLANCPRKYGYRYVLGLRLPFDGVAVTKGTAVHHGLEWHYAGKDWRVGMQQLRSKPEFAGVIENAIAILGNYFQVYKHEKLNVVSVEREYAIRVEGFLFTRRLDLVFERDGLLWIVDHKTAADPKRRTGQSELDPTLMSQELIGRVACTVEHGLKYGGALLNLIPTGSGGKFSRWPLHFPARMIQDMPRSLARWLKGEAAMLSSDVSPWEYTQTWACYSKYGVCDYWTLCTQGPDALDQYTMK